MSLPRHSLHLYDDVDPSKVFSLVNNAGVVTLTPDAAASLTVSGNATLLGSTTSVTRAAPDGTLSDSTLENTFDGLDLLTATNAASIVTENTRATTQENTLDTKIDTEEATLQGTDSSNLASILTAVTARTSAAQIAEGLIQSSITAEETRATQAEADATTLIDALVITESDNHTTTTNAIDAEVLRASASEAAIQADEDANEAAAAAALATADTNLQNQIDANAVAIAAQTTTATAVESGLQGQINSVLNNSDGVALNSLQEIVTHFDGNDDTHMNLLGLLMNKVLQINTVLDTALSPDLPALDAVLQAHFDANLCLTSLAGSGADGSSLTNVLGDGEGHTSSTHSMSYFLNQAFSICYDLTQRVIFEDGVAVLKDFDYIAGDLWISGKVSDGTHPDYATGQTAWDALVAVAGDAQTAYQNDIGVSADLALKGLISTYYGFLPTDLTSVCLPYNDPQHYCLTVGQYGERPLYKGNEVTYEPFMGWSLDYCTVAGDASTKYSSIMSGSQAGNTLTISSMADGSGAVKALEFPVSGNALTGERYGVFISDMTQLTTA